MRNTSPVPQVGIQPRGAPTGKFLNNKHLLAGLLVLSTFALAGFLYLRSHSANPAAVATVDKTIQLMRKHPGDWKAEKDVTGLMGDFKANDIAAIGITPSEVLVTTRGGARYFVKDYAGKISAVVLAEYQKIGQPNFQLAVLSSADGLPSFGTMISVGTGIVALLLYLGMTYFQPFGKSEETGVRFKDVIGCDEAKQAFSDIVDYLRDPKKYAEFGAKPPKGVLLVGPPGGGKTHLARALAGESKAHFLVITGSEFSSPLYGQGITRAKRLFAKAKRHAPCILFIDEIDGIGQRTKVERASDAEPNRIINQILTEMDGFRPASGVIVIGATNKPDDLDEALLREGRFDRKINVNVPGVDDRKALFEYYTGKLKSTDTLDLNQLARITTGLTPAAISSIVNTAAFSAARQNSVTLQMCHLSEAIENASMGELSSAGKLLSPEERRRIAVHEAGHAIISKFTNTGTLEKVTILPRGPALGVTLVTPDKETELYLRSELENRIQMYLAGRIAEKLVLGDISSGATGDLTEASILAFRMVSEMGMGKDGKLFSIGACQKLGLHTDHLFYLDQTQELLNEMEIRCAQSLDAVRPALDQLVEMLLERETVPGPEVAALLDQQLAGA